MASADVELTWNDRVFASIPVAPAWVGLAIAVVGVAGFVGARAAFGYLAVYDARDLPVWEERDARFPLLFAVLAGYTPVARRYASLWTRRNLLDVARLFPSGESGIGSPVRAGLPLGGVVGMALVPLGAWAVDGAPNFLGADYWGGPQLFTWGLGLTFAWHTGLFGQEQIRSARRFRLLATALPGIDLLDTRGLAPFARQGMQAALLWVLVVAIFALNVVDPGAAGTVVVMALAGFAVGATGFALPVLGVHRRIRDAKREEIAHVAHAIRGETAALQATGLAGRGEPLGVADLLAYRAHVESIREWPLDAGARLRLLLYLSIPLGSWLGGAFVERMLTAVLD